MIHKELSKHCFPGTLKHIGIGISHCRYGGSFEVEGTHDIDQGLCEVISHQLICVVHTINSITSFFSPM